MGPITCHLADPSAALLCSNNEFVPSSNGETFSTVNPATGEHLLDFHAASAEDVDKAVAAARKAFKTTWGRNVAATERARCTLDVASLQIESWFEITDH